MKHKHHIIPKHMGGSDEPSNLIELTIEEHAEVHRVLFEKYGKIQDKMAWLGLLKLASDKEIYAEFASQPKSEEHKKKISEAHKGKKKPWVCGGKGNLGKPKTKEHCENISKGKKGKPVSALLGNKNASGNKGKPKSDEHIKAVRDALNTTEVKDKIAKAWANKPIVSCPHCGRQGKEGHNMIRYHFENCKERK